MTRYLPLPWPSRGLPLLLLSSALLLGGWLATGQAQVRTTITPDGTLGTTVRQGGNVYTISGGTQYGPVLQGQNFSGITFGATPAPPTSHQPPDPDTSR